MTDEKKIIQVPNDENEEISIDNESSLHKRKIIFVNKKEIIKNESKRNHINWNQNYCDCRNAIMYVMGCHFITHMYHMKIERK